MRFKDAAKVKVGDWLAVKETGEARKVLGMFVRQPDLLAGFVKFHTTDYYANDYRECRHDEVE